MIHDATPSWSGYNYQGKVAIHYLLKHIAEKLKVDPNYDFSGDSLLLENHEDFEFYEKNNCRSLHQVKAYADQKYSEYEHAIFNLALNLHLNKHRKGYIHSWKKINCSDLNLAASEKIKDLIQRYDDDISSSEIFLTSVKNKESNKYVKIMKKAFPKKTPTMIYTELKLVLYKIKIFNIKIRPYKYKHNEFFCSIDKIDDYIKEELREIIIINNVTLTDKQLDKITHHLIYQIDLHVTARHLGLAKQTSKKHLQASCILDIAKKDHENSSDEYFDIKFKIFLFKIFDRFLTSEFYITPKYNINCNLTQVRKTLENISPERLFLYYVNFSPSVLFSNNNNTDKSLLVNSNGTHDILLRIFHEINHAYCQHDGDKNALFYRSSQATENYYLPTTMNEASLSAIVRAISENDRLLVDLYEINNFIYNGENCDDFYSHLEINSTAPESSSEEQRESWVERIRKLKLIDIETAKRDI